MGRRGCGGTARADNGRPIAARTGHSMRACRARAETGLPHRIVVHRPQRQHTPMTDRECSMSSIVSAGVLDEVVPAACDDLQLDVRPAVVGPTGSRVAGESTGRFGVWTLTIMAGRARQGSKADPYSEGQGRPGRPDSTARTAPDTAAIHTARQPRLLQKRCWSQ